MPSGKFIVFEGIDGSGKSTLIHLLAEVLKKKQVPFLLTREPGGTPLGEEIRRLLLRIQDEAPSPRTELLMYESIRAEHVEKLIRPALNRGQWVVCDRFAASSVAFQSAARGLPVSDIDWLNGFATAGLNADITVLLDLPVEESIRRRQKRVAGGQPEDRFEREKTLFHEKVRQSYLAQAQAAPNDWVVLNSLLPKEEVFRALWTHLEKKQWVIES